MLFFVMTRGNGEANWSKRGTISARSPGRAIAMMKRDFRIPTTTQVRALSQGYPVALQYNPAPRPLVKRINGVERIKQNLLKFRVMSLD